MGTKKWVAGAAGVLASALALTACTPAPQTSSTALNSGSVANVAWNDTFYSYNNLTTFGNATVNTNIIYMSNDAFNYYDKDLNLVKNESLGNYEKVSDKPLVVKQTLADTAMWSDGVPVTPADLVLFWGAQSGLFNTYKSKVDADTGAVGKNSGSKVFFNASSPNLALIKPNPKILADCFKNSLYVAARHEAHSIAFPALGAGAFRWDPKQVAQIAFTAINEWVQTNKHISPIHRIVLVAYNDEVQAAFEEAFTLNAVAELAA